MTKMTTFFLKLNPIHCTTCL